MKNIVAFADEFGNNSFDFNNGTHFIVASVFTNADNGLNLEQNIEGVRKKYFKTGEIKSTSIGANHRRRLIILQEVVKYDFSIYAVVVDKRKLYGEGFRYKSSFYKFLNSLVYKELFKTFPDLLLTVDEHGSNNFMRGFKKYVGENHIPSLFDKSEFAFQNSTKSVLIQLADLIAGSLGHYFDETKKSDETQEILNILQPKIASINYFPPEMRMYKVDSTEADQMYNSVIAELSVNKARDFIEKKTINSQVDKDQVNCIRLLLLYFTSYDYKKFILTTEIMKHLSIGRDEPIQEHAFRTKVIAKLRDAGVLVASSSSGDKKGGYKLPASTADLHKFVSHGNTMILPMLSRIAKTRDSIKLATENTIDILEQPEFKNLKKIMDNFKPL